MDANEAWEWIKENKDRLSEKELEEALDRWCEKEGYKYLVGSDIIWIWENTDEKEIKNQKTAEGVSD